MTNIQSRLTINWVISNLHFELSVYFVPDENIGKDSEGLCIRRRNQKYLDGKTVESNPIIIGSSEGAIYT